MDARRRARPPVAWRAPAALACVAAGLFAGRHLDADALWALGLAASLALIALAARGRWSVIAAMIAATALGAGWWSARIDGSPARPLLETLEAREARALTTVEGLVLAAPRVEPIERGRFARFGRPGHSVRFPLRVRTIHTAEGERRATGEMTVYTEGEAVRAGAGAFVRVSGFASPAGVRHNPGQAPSRLLALQDGRAGTLRAATPANVERIEPPPDLAWRARAALARAKAAVRERAGAWLDAPGGGGDPARALLRAVVLGERGESLRDVGGAMRRVGVAHMLSISGLHLTLLAFAAMLVLRVAGDFGRWEPWIVVALVLAYLVVVPVRSPVLRAGIMTAGLLAGESAGRRYDRVSVLCWAAVATLLWRPMELWSAGAQLSYACVAALILFTGPLRERFFGEPPEPELMTPARRALEWAKDGFSASLVAWLVASPIVALHVGVFSPLGALAAVALAPLFAVMLALAYGATLASIVLPSLGVLALPVALALGDLMARVALAIESLPLVAVRLPALSPLWGASALLVIWLWLAGWRRARVLAAIAIGCAAWLGVQLWRAHATAGLRKDVALRVDMLDVSDGTCVLVRSGGEAMLWDCGSRIGTLGERALPDAVRALGAWRVPTLWITHPNLDHYSATLDVRWPAGIERVVLGRRFEQAARETGTPEAMLLGGLDDHGVETEVVAGGETFALGRARGAVLWPEPGADHESDNDMSLVVELTVPTTGGDRGVLLTGDIEPDAAAALLRRRPDLSADVLELPHHGSARLAPTGFVEALGPSVVLQSSGRMRLGDERWDDAKAGRSWLMTAEVGGAWAEVLEDGSVRSGAVRLSE